MSLQKLITWCIAIFPSLAFCQNDSFPTSGNASFYHSSFQGKETSSGEDYDQTDFTAAHRTLPFNSIVHVTNKQNNKSAVVRINDRGPFKKSRIIDLTHSAAKKLDMIPFGVVPVKIQRLTYLDRIVLTDSMFSENETWDCFAKKVTLPDSAIYVWETRSSKHAFYMASDMLLDYHLPDVYVQVKGKDKMRKYRLIIPMGGEIIPADLLKTLKQDGFQHAKIYFAVR